MWKSKAPDAQLQGVVASLIRRISSAGRRAAGSTPAGVRDHAGTRLEQRTVRLLESLPPELRLVALRGQFPRVLNRIAASWHDAREFRRTIDSLLLDERGRRQGFPFEVLRELTDLRDYYFTMVRPQPATGGLSGLRE